LEWERQGSALGEEHGLCAHVSVENKGLDGRQETAGRFLHFEHLE